MPSEKEDAVRELAYRLWLARGRQDGCALQDWLDAKRLLGADAGAPEPPIKVPNPPEGEVDDVIPETPKVASRDAPGG